MKSFLYSFFFVSFLLNISFGQNCIPVALIFNTQQQIDDFSVNYPGCTIVDGNIGITGNNITNLNGLSQITEIGGSLQILDANGLTNLNGLNNLQSVGGSLILNSVSALTSMSGLGQLNNVGSNISINNCGVLPSLNGLGTITQIPGNLFLTNNGSLADITAFNNLNSVGGNINIISYSSVLNLSGFSALQTIGGNLLLEGSTDQFSALNALTTVSGELAVNNNHHISTLNGFSNLSLVNQLTISNNNNLVNISGLQNLQFLASNISIFNNPFLSNISGLDHPITCNVFSIQNNPFLSDCSVESVCVKLWKTEGNMIVMNNGTNCNDLDAVLLNCGNAPDADNDNINDFLDNCPDMANPGQEDWNSDGYGDACQDSDNDTVMDAVDNCLQTSNPGQEDCDSNGIGDSCTDFTSDTTVTACYYFIWEAGDGNTYTQSGVYQFDTTFVNGCAYSHTLNLTITNSGNVFNISRTACLEFIWDGYLGNGQTYTASGNYIWYPDPCTKAILELIIDSTGAHQHEYQNTCGPYFWTNGGYQYFTERGVYDFISISSEGCPDTLTLHLNINEGPDGDNDGWSDDCDNCPDIANADQTDCNNNGIGDVCELSDSDCDGIFDTNDNCPELPNPFQTDQNNNGIGDACEDFPKIGFNVETPRTELHLGNGSLFIDNPEKGIILKNYEGNCYMIRMNGANLVAVAVACP